MIPKRPEERPLEMYRRTILNVPNVIVVLANATITVDREECLSSILSLFSIHRR
jgi:hypothetical protein